MYNLPHYLIYNLKRLLRLLVKYLQNNRKTIFKINHKILSILINNCLYKQFEIRILYAIPFVVMININNILNHNLFKQKITYKKYKFMIQDFIYHY